MKRQALGALVLCCTAFCCMAKDKTASAGIVLKTDYSSPRECSYSVSYTSQGNFRQKSSNTAKSTEISCLLAVTKTDAKKLAVKADSVTVKSDVYKEDVRKEIKDKIAGSEYSLSLANGYPSLDTGAAIPASASLEWDLYRQLSKLLPVLPAKPVKPGFTWERTDVFPMKTARGTVSCEVYRAYVLKSLSGDSATITWKFRYSGTGGTADSSVLTQIPVYGTGNGTALIDIRKGLIEHADMNFTTPVAVVGDVSVVWHEKAEMRLVEVK